MRLSFFLLFLNFISLSAKNQTRILSLSFKDECIKLSDAQKTEIVQEYISVGAGDWLSIHTVSKSNSIISKKSAIKLAKVRNRVVTSFLIDKGVSQTKILYKYDVIERIWIHKPRELMSAVALNNKKESTCYSFINSQGFTARFESGNSIVFKPNSFDVFSSEKINICIEEYVSKIDFVKNGVTANGEKGMLESQGMYNLTAKCNGSRVRLRKGINYQLLIRDGDIKNPFYAFYGKEKGRDLSWVKGANDKFKMSTSIESGTGVELVEDEFGEEQEVMIKWEGEVTVLSGSFSKLGWINCDRFYEEEEKITMNFKIESKSSIQVFVVFHDINSVMPASKVLKGEYEISGIPKGESISIIAVNTNDENSSGELGYFKTISNSNQKVEFKTETISSEKMTRILDDVIY